MATFDTIKSERTILKVDKKEAPVLAPYFQAEMERASATYEKKYKFKLDTPIQVEVYPNHTDFEVRTMGLPGLGALGCDVRGTWSRWTRRTAANLATSTGPRRCGMK